MHIKHTGDCCSDFLRTYKTEQSQTQGFGKPVIQVGRKYPSCHLLAGKASRQNLSMHIAFSHIASTVRFNRNNISQDGTKLLFQPFLPTLSSGNPSRTETAYGDPSMQSHGIQNFQPLAFKHTLQRLNSPQPCFSRGIPSSHPNYSFSSFPNTLRLFALQVLLFI